LDQSDIGIELKCCLISECEAFSPWIFFPASYWRQNVEYQRLFFRLKSTYALEKKKKTYSLFDSGAKIQIARRHTQNRKYKMASPPA
jgi:hypothetical protein